MERSGKPVPEKSGYPDWNRFRIITGFLHDTGGHGSSCRRYLQMPGSPGTPGSRNNGTGTGHIHLAGGFYVSEPYQPGGSLCEAYSVKVPAYYIKFVREIPFRFFLKRLRLKKDRDLVI
jgi:hypothetical protein